MGLLLGLDHAADALADAGVGAEILVEGLEEVFPGGFGSQEVLLEGLEGSVSRGDVEERGGDVGFWE